MDGPKTLSEWIQYLHAAAEAKQADPADTEAQEAIDFALQRIQRLQTEGTARDVQAGEAESRAAMAGAGMGIAQGMGALYPAVGAAARENPEATAALTGGILHGASLGAGEPLAGLGGVIRGEGFREGARGYREATQALEEVTPGAFGVGEILGGAAQGAIPISSGLRAGTAYARALPGAKPLRRFFSAAAHTPVQQGAVQGGVAGFSAGGEDPGDIGARVRTGAGGAVLGASLQGLFGGLGGLRASRVTPDGSPSSPPRPEVDVRPTPRTPPDPLDVPTFQRRAAARRAAVPETRVVERSLERPIPGNRPRPGHPIFFGERSFTRSAEVRAGKAIAPDRPTPPPAARHPQAEALVRQQSFATLQRAMNDPSTPPEVRAVIQAEFERRGIVFTPDNPSAQP